ncbi:hypothetical protein ACQ4PT_019991 [Festuca glaucescens]
MTKSRATLMTRAGVLESAQAVQVCVPGEYPFLRRFRLRRLIAFLWLQGCSSTFYAMLKQTNVYFCVHYLARLVCNGQWTVALDYIVPRFLRAVPQRRSMEANLLIKFLSQHRLFQLEVARQIRVDMRPVWAKAAGIVRDLANRTPEFRNRRLLPAGPMGQQNVLPIGFGFAPFRRRWHVKKHRQQSSAVAKLYLDKRRSSLQLSSSNRNQKLSRAEESLEVLIRPPELNQGFALQSSVREGTPVTGNVINPECSSVPLTTDEGAPVCHAMFVDGINSAENSAILSMTKTGELVKHPHFYAN